MTNTGKRPKFGDIILTQIQFVDSYETKTRPVLVLFEEFGNIVVAALTSNPEMEGIKITKKEGVAKDSVIKLNYIFTISEKMVKKFLFKLSDQKKKEVRNEIIKKLKIN